MLARRDGLGSGTDDLVVAPHRLARSDGPRGHLVPRRHQADDGDLLVQALGSHGADRAFAAALHRAVELER